MPKHGTFGAELGMERGMEHDMEHGTAPELASTSEFTAVRILGYCSRSCMHTRDPLHAEACDAPLLSRDDYDGIVNYASLMCGSVSKNDIATELIATSPWDLMKALANVMLVILGRELYTINISNAVAELAPVTLRFVREHANSSSIASELTRQVWRRSKVSWRGRILAEPATDALKSSSRTNLRDYLQTYPATPGTILCVATVVFAIVGAPNSYKAYQVILERPLPTV
jgi:hypothetical protein